MSNKILTGLSQCKVRPTPVQQHARGTAWYEYEGYLRVRGPLATRHRYGTTCRLKCEGNGADGSEAGESVHAIHPSSACGRGSSSTEQRVSMRFGTNMQ